MEADTERSSVPRERAGFAFRAPESHKVCPTSQRAPTAGADYAVVSCEVIGMRRLIRTLITKQHCEITVKPQGCTYIGIH
eukprot:9651245-Alexandrium_andersonii.AAC.1